MFEAVRERETLGETIAVVQMRCVKQQVRCAKLHAVRGNACLMLREPSDARLYAVHDLGVEGGSKTNALFARSSPCYRSNEVSSMRKAS